MSNAALAAVQGNKPAARKANDTAHMLCSPAMLAQLKAALPRHMTAERLTRIALTELRKTPKLGQCDPRTFCGAVMQLAQLGIEPGGLLGHAYLIPFENTKKKTTDVQIIIGYRGMIDLARRSGQIASINAVIARDGDEFQVHLGDTPKLHHVPAYDDDKPMRWVYAVAVFKDGGRQFEVMTRPQVERVRNASQGYKRGGDNPWITHFEEMSKKTVIRRLFKYLPVSIELQQAVALDEHGDAGLSQVVDDMGALEGTATDVEIEKDVSESTEVGDKASTDLGGGYTFDQVLTAILNAKDGDQFNAAIDLVRSLNNPDERKRAEDAAAKKRELLETGEIK